MEGRGFISYPIGPIVSTYLYSISIGTSGTYAVEEIMHKCCRIQEDNHRTLDNYIFYN